PNIPDYQNDQAGTMVNLARLLCERNDFPQARDLLQDAGPYHQRALQANPQHPKYRENFGKNRSLLALTLARLRDHIGAREVAEQLAALDWDRADHTFKAACALAQCVPAAEQDAKLPEARRHELARDYADRALALLRQAVTLDYEDAAHMREV